MKRTSSSASWAHVSEPYFRHTSCQLAETTKHPRHIKAEEREDHCEEQSPEYRHGLMISAPTEDVGMFEEARVASDAQPLQNELHKTEPSRQTANTRLIQGHLSSTLPVVRRGLSGACST